MCNTFSTTYTGAEAITARVNVVVKPLSLSPNFPRPSSLSYYLTGTKEIATVSTTCIATRNPKSPKVKSCPSSLLKSLLAAFINSTSQ
jgi:hypothetical protein